MTNRPSLAELIVAPAMAQASCLCVQQNDIVVREAEGIQQELAKIIARMESEPSTTLGDILPTLEGIRTLVASMDAAAIESRQAAQIMKDAGRKEYFDAALQPGTLD